MFARVKKSGVYQYLQLVENRWERPPGNDGHCRQGNPEPDDVRYAPSADTAKELESAGVGVKHHLKCFTGVGNAERLPAVAQSELSDLYFRQNATHQQLLIIQSN